MLNPTRSAGVVSPKRAGAMAILIVLSSSALALAAAECVLQLFYPLGDVKVRYHPELLFEPVPNSRRIYRRLPEDGGGTLVSRTNRLGLIGDEVPERKAGLRVVVFGDSNVDGYYVRPEDTLVRQLEGRLELQFKRPVEVLNAGLQGYGTDQALLRMESLLPRLEADHVVLVVTALNDFSDLLRNRLFRLEGNGKLVRNRPRVSAELQHKFRPRDAIWYRSQVLLHAAAALNRLRAGGESPATGDGLAAALDRSRRWYDDFVLRGNDETQDLLVSYPNFELYLEPEGEVARFEVRLMRAILAEIKLQLGDRLTLAILGGSRCPSSANYPQCHAGNEVRVVETAARDFRIAYVTLDPRLSTPDFTLPRDGHWNERAQALAAEEIAQHLGKIDWDARLPIRKISSQR